MITRIMPIMFVIFSLNFPAGLAVYWCTSGLWRIGQQHLIGKRIYTEENKARLEAAKARNEELMATTEPGFMDKVFGGAQPRQGSPRATRVPRARWSTPRRPRRRMPARQAVGHAEGRRQRQGRPHLAADRRPVASGSGRSSRGVGADHRQDARRGP